MRKTNDAVILQMLEDGKTQKQVAEHFDVSPAAICKRVKKLMPPPESLERLTPKEQRFAVEVAKGSTQTQAALVSHECGSRDSAKSLGYQLMQKPDIQVAVNEIMQQQGLTRGYRVHKLKQHVDAPDPNVSLKALDQSWKLDGAYAAEKHLNVNVDYSDLVRNLDDIYRRKTVLLRKLGHDDEAELVERQAELHRKREGQCFSDDDVVDAEIDGDVQI
jgi:predicted transcriptional regulator